jgi:cystathionine gamma-lyase
MAERRARGDGTRTVRAGLPAPEQGAPFLPGPTFATGYHLRGDDPHVTPYGYARYGNPTWSALEAAVAELEGEDVQALAFASGAAAIAALLFATVSQGETVVVPRDAYPAARWVADELERLGARRRLVGTDTEETVQAAAGAKLVLVETPSNPSLEVVDVTAVADAARQHGARLVVDNTIATPLGQRPLDLGADATVLSGSKHLTGHGDLLLGTVTTRDEELLKALRAWRDRTGAILGPFEAWLAHRSIATLGVRLERQCANAQAIAELLAGRDDVGEVRYPGLPTDRSHPLAVQQMSRYGSVLSFDLGTSERANAFLHASQLIAEATSFGAVHTTAERRARWGTDDISPGLIRLSAGIEDAADLLADVDAALDAARA